MDDEANLKQQINNFVWMHAPGQMKLKEAETLAVKIFDLFMLERRRFDHKVVVTRPENS